MAQRVASGCLVFHEGNCLLLRRSALEDTMQGLWEMPAGKIESDLDGSPEENAIRETLEEAGIALGDVVPLGEHLTETKIFYGFLGVSDTADVELSFEHDAFVWMSVPDILAAVAADDMMVGHHTVYFLQQLLDDAEDFMYEAESFAADSCIECGRKEGPYADTVLIACPGCPELTCQHCYDEEKQGCLFCIRKRAETFSAEKITKEELIEYLDWLEEGEHYVFDTSPRAKRFHDLLAGDLQINSADVDFMDQDEFILLGAEEIPMGVAVKSFKTTSKIYYNRRLVKQFYGPRHREKADSIAGYYARKVQKNPNYFNYLRYEAEEYTEDSTFDTDVAIAQSLFALVTIRDLLMQNMTDEALEFINGEYLPEARVDEIIDDDLRAEVQAFIDSKSPPLSYDAESTSKPVRVEIKRATIDPYKLTAVFYDKDDKKIKTTHFGDERYEDYTIHKDKERLKNYNTRHGAKSAGEKWQKPMTAGALSKWILWNKPSLKASFDDYKRRFKLKGELKAKTSGGRKRAETFATEYTPSQTLGEYDARELALSSVATGDFFTDSLKFSTTRKAAESDEDAKKLREYEKTYGKKQAKIRMRLKKKIYKERSMGTKAGQWSARKSQKLKREYETACERAGLKPYKTSKTEKQEDLEDWSDQDWKTSSGKKSSKTGEPYFPAKAVEALKKKGLYAKAKRQKAKATKAGKQNARYSDDIRKVVAKYRAESFRADTDVVLYLGTSTRFLDEMERVGLEDPMLTLDILMADDYAVATAQQYGGNAIVIEVSAFAELLDQVDWQGDLFEYFGDIPPAALYVMDWDDDTESWS